MSLPALEWIEIGKAEKFGPGFHLQGQGRRRFVLAVIDGQLFAFSPVCPHAGGPLELAETEGMLITCPLHGWRFDLTRNGEESHGYRSACMYDVRVEHGKVFVGLPEVK